MVKILLTGATGFVGQRLTTELLEKKYSIVASVRKQSTNLPENIRQDIVGDLSQNTEWGEALHNIDVVIHAASRVHVMKEASLDIDPLTDFRRVNVDGTLNLVQQSITAGVKRFIFISSIKVNGEMTSLGHPFTAADSISVKDPYGLSKYEAEQGLLELAKNTDMEVVIVRPPLIYGPNVKANFQSMIRWVNKGVPLPFASVRNQRSLLALDNLVDFIICCIYHPKAGNEVFLISDNEDVSMTELLQKIAKALGKRPRLFPIPVKLVWFLAKMIGKGDLCNRLFGSLQVDSSRARDLLGWKPVITMDEQLKKIADAYLK